MLMQIVKNALFFNYESLLQFGIGQLSIVIGQWSFVICHLEFEISFSVIPNLFRDLNELSISSRKRRRRETFIEQSF